MEKLEVIREELKNELSEKRYNHCINVMEKCIELAEIYGENIEKAALVGLTHDIAKEIPIEGMFKYVEENNIEIDDIERKNPKLLHAKIGADICKRKYGWTKDMCSAIEAHTTGKPHMDKLAKILYISDAISKEREGDYVEEARKLIVDSLDNTMIYLLETFITDCINRKKEIHPDALLAIQDLRMKIKVN